MSKRISEELLINYFELLIGLEKEVSLLNNSKGGTIKAGIMWLGWFFFEISLWKSGYRLKRFPEFEWFQDAFKVRVLF